MRPFIRFCLLLCFLGSSIQLTWAQSNQEEKFGQLSTEHGLSQSVVTCILQDSRGFLWFGTQDGLNRYDGYSFKVFKPEEREGAISGKYIQCLYEDSKGRIWVGTKNKGLNRFDRNTETFTSYTFSKESKNALPDSTVLSVLENHKGVLWVGTNRGLCKMVGDGKFELFNLKKAEEDFGWGIINALGEDRENRLWIGTEQGVLRSNRDYSSFEAFRNDPDNPRSLSNNTVHCFFRDRHGNLFIGTDQGVNRFREKTNQFERVDPEGLGKEEVYSITEDKRGALWMATFGGGLWRYFPSSGQLHFFVNDPSDRESLGQDHLLSTYVDLSGRLWLGTYGMGINTLDLVRVKFKVLTSGSQSASALPGNDVFAVTTTPSGHRLVGTDQGLSIRNAQTGKAFVLRADANPLLAGNTVYALLAENDSAFWVGTDEGLSRVIHNWKTGQTEVINYRHQAADPNSLVDNVVTSLYKDPVGLWVGTSAGLSHLKKGSDKFINYTEGPANQSGLSHGQINCISGDGVTSVWAGTDDGVTLIPHGSAEFQHFFAPQSGPGATSSQHGDLSTILCMKFDKKTNLLWLGTGGGGLRRENITTFTSEVFTTEDGLPDDFINGILEDEDGNLWISTNKGISLARVENTDDNFSVHNYTTENGLPTEAFNYGAFHRDRSGTLYFGSSEGMVYFHPEDIKGNTYAPPVVITDFQLFFKDVPVGKGKNPILSKVIGETEEIVLRHNQNALHFTFSALNYIESENNQYAFYLEGYEEDWNYVNNTRQATYTNLDPGEYVFHVKGANNEGVWHETGTSLKIVINKPFYQTIWFYALCGGALMLLIYLIIMMRTRNLMRVRNYLEQMVDERTKEVVTRKNEIEEKNKELEQISEEIAAQRDELYDKNEELNAALEKLTTAQAQLVESEKMASLGQLTAGVAHEINNPINFVSGNVMPLKRDLQDLLELVEKYQATIREEKLEDQFQEVEDLKEEIDYDFLLKEINNLLDGIEVGAKRTTEIVRGLKNFSRLDENDAKSVNLNEGLDSTLLILHNEFKNRVEVVKEFGDIPPIVCFPGKINQVFMNILSNAGQAIEEKGVITVKSWQEGAWVNVSIRDNGKGMPEEVRKRIFEPFYTTKDVGKGTGLGLSISYGIVENHGGKITVSSEEGVGTEFLITLPVDGEPIAKTEK